MRGIFGDGEQTRLVRWQSFVYKGAIIAVIAFMRLAKENLTLLSTSTYGNVT